MIHKIAPFALLAILLMTTTTGCIVKRHGAPRSALVGHIVFVNLKDENHDQEMLNDSDAMLAMIPSVSIYAAGKHIDTGRSTIINDYDLAIYLGFESIEDLNAYVAHEQHVSFVTKWKPHLESLRVYDMFDPTP